MRVDLPVLSYATAGCPLLGAHDVALPPPGPRGRRARLPELAVAMARLAAGDRETDEQTSVVFGTALGCLTETESFVENMIRAKEATPKPRAFSASVHNAIASRVAMALVARGACRTFVHGEISFLLALRSARTPALVGALDEHTPYVDRGRAACTSPPGKGEPGEGGAVFFCGEGPPLAIIREVRFARPDDPAAWIAERAEGADATLRAPGDHPSSAAVTTAIAVAVLAGTLEPPQAGLDQRPGSIAVAAASRLGDAGVLIVEQAP